MSGRSPSLPAKGEGISTALLVAGVCLAALTEAVAGTVPALGRADIAGALHATPDEAAWFDTGYVATKMAGFLLAAAVIRAAGLSRLLVGATLAMGLACLLAAGVDMPGPLVGLRLVQGLAGGIILVAGQTALFLALPSRRQPLPQALFAFAAVIVPATLAPALQGCLLEHGSWRWIFLAMVPVAMLSTGLLVLAAFRPVIPAAARPADGVSIMLAGGAFFCASYVFGRGSRWNWFEAPHVAWLAVIGIAALIALALRRAMAGGGRGLDLAPFRSPDFAFAFAVSFVAGAALLGSSFLIPSFAAAVLGFAPVHVGLLILPGAAPFAGAILLAAVLVQRRGLPPIATVPFGIVMVMAAMWMLSASSAESGADDMMAALLLRGLGLGFLFLSITLIAFGRLPAAALAAGIAYFNVGRQVGGLIGVAALQTLIDRQAVANATVLGAHLASGAPALRERIQVLQALLRARGADAAEAGRIAAGMLGRLVAGQSSVIAFDTAFTMLALLFVVAVPLLVAFRIVLSRIASRGAGAAPADGPQRSTHGIP